MTDRHIAYLVMLSDSIREDDAEATLTALRMVRGVAGVVPVIDPESSALAAQAAKFRALSDVRNVLRQMDQQITDEIRRA